jgi:type I restriction enzyme M protein
MSYEEFRKRIDTARQILVGAVPSPAGQIDQITYALMYKFMNDIDDQSAALGGKRTYFVDDYAQYNWHELMKPGLEAHDQLELYRQAIQGMNKNPGLPPLFREIYQNAFLPFNSPSVLRLFLNEINKFNHGDTDDIGDAYEYLLSITGAQGDVGQFRTPRHIIKFIVEAVNPTKDDSVLDPAVGTAGFLIAAYNHVKSQHDGKDNQGNTNDKKRLTADELEKLHHNYRGFDIDPTMVRTASVNLYLHGFTSPDIRNHDSLSDDKYWKDQYNVILANPPFMSPKGGIQPHKKFSISANRAEVLFVDYIASHLKPNGRAGVVVPEGIIFQSGKAYRELRKNLVENYVYAVISLPAGVFQPYSGVKTSVLLMDKQLAKERDDILFVKIENDGYTLGAQRRRDVLNDQLPQALDFVKLYQENYHQDTPYSHTVSRKEIGKSGDYNLSGDRYKVVEPRSEGGYKTVEMGDIIEFLTDYTANGSFASLKENVRYSDVADYAQLVRLKDLRSDLNNSDRVFVSKHAYDFLKKTKLNEGDFLVANVGANVGDTYLMPRAAMPSTLGPNMYLVKFDERKALAKYVYLLNEVGIIKNQVRAKSASAAQPKINKTDFRSLKIPLPPIKIQREIITELDSYRKIIDAADTINKFYRPTIEGKPDWQKIPFREVATLEYGKALPARIRESGPYPVLGSNGVSGVHSTYLVRGPGIVIGRKGSAGEVTWVDDPFYPIDTTYFIKINDERQVMMKFLYYQLIDMNLRLLKNGAGIPGLNREDVYASKFFLLPPIEIQHEIVDKLEAEQKIINANKKLAEIYQQKIKTKLAEIWGE